MGDEGSKQYIRVPPLRKLLASGSLYAFIFACSGPVLAAQDTFKLVSWNLQAFNNVSPQRQSLCKAAYANVFTQDVDVFAFQEVGALPGLNILLRIIPGSTEAWRASFENTKDSQDNGILVRNEKVKVLNEGLLFVDSSGKPNFTMAKHPIRFAYLKVGDFDFLLLSLHLTYVSGDAMSSKRELVKVLKWLDDYWSKSGSDPDVVICGDYNLPSTKGKPLSKRKNDKSWIPIETILDEHASVHPGIPKLCVLVDDPTSRSKKMPANNYDHFIMSEHALKSLVSASRVDINDVNSVDKKPTVPATLQVSDHYPIGA